MPGTSFHNTTRLALSARARSVADRSVPPRPMVVTLPSGARPMKPGITTIVPAARRGRRTRRARRVVSAWFGAAAAVMLVGGHHLERVDILRPPAGACECRGENLPRHPLAARDDPVAGSRRQVIEQADSGTEVAIFTGSRVHGSEELSPGRSRRYQGAHHLAMPAQERRSVLADVGPAPGQGMGRTLEQEVGDPRQRRRHDDERSLMSARSARPPSESGRRRRAMPRRISRLRAGRVNGRCVKVKEPRYLLATAVLNRSTARRTAS